MNVVRRMQQPLAARHQSDRVLEIAGLLLEQEECDRYSVAPASRASLDYHG